MGNLTFGTSADKVSIIISKIQIINNMKLNRLCMLITFVISMYT